MSVNKSWFSTVFVVELAIALCGSYTSSCSKLCAAEICLPAKLMLAVQVLDQPYQSLNYFLHILFHCRSWLYVSPDPVVLRDLVSITVLFASAIFTAAPCQMWVKQSLHIRSVNRLLYTVCLLESVLVRHSSSLVQGFSFFLQLFSVKYQFQSFIHCKKQFTDQYHRY